MNHQSKIFCFRVIVIIVTALLWLLGGGMLGVAIWFRFDFWINQYVAASEELEKYAILVYIVIAAGAFIVLFGIIGIIGAVRPEKTLHNIFLIVYLVFWVLVLLLLIAGGVYGYVYRKEMEDALKRSNLLKNVVQKVYGTDKKVTNGIDYMQVELKCCGGTGPLDYTESTWRYGDPLLPDSRKNMTPLTCCQDYWKYKDANTVNYKYCPLFVDNTANDPLKNLNYNIYRKANIREPVPPPLAQMDQVTKDQHFETTYGKSHDTKYPTTVYSNPIFKKAPGHWKVDYVKDLAEKLDKGGWRRPLTTGNQMSETREQYSAPPGIRQKYHFDDAAGLGLPQPFNLKDHHVEGPSKYGQGTTENPKLKGEPFYVRDKGILRHLDPYLSTTHKDHRSFHPDEQKKYPKKDIATYWECEEYPKAWGFGLKHNPLPKDTVPREPLPMRDPTFFTTRTKIPRPPKALVPVPHSGLKSLKQDSYTWPSDVKRKEAMFCPVDTPYTLPKPGTKSMMTAPKMYNTEYQHIGSNKPITV